MIAVSVTLVAIGISMAIACMLAIMMRFDLLRWAIGIMIFGSAIGLQISKTGMVYGSWMEPVMLLRAEIFLGGGLLLLFGVFLHSPMISLRGTSWQAWILFALTVYQGLMRTAHGSGISGLQTIGGAVLTILPLLLIIPALLRNRWDWNEIVRVFMWVNVAWILCVFMQVVKDPSRLTYGWDDRFIGVGGNPQHTAVYLAVSSVFALWLLLNDHVKRYQLLWLALFAANVIMLVGTGSRTGLGMALLGATVILHHRLGRMVLLLPFGVLALYGAYRLILTTGLTFGFERVISLENTRAIAWQHLLQEAFENPLMGNFGEEITKSENSYLWGFASFGFVFFALCIVMLMGSIAHCLALLRVGRWYPSSRKYADLGIAFYMMYFAGAMFEGYIVLRANIMVCGLVIIGSMSAMLLHLHRMGELEGADEEECSSHWYDSDWEVKPAVEGK